MSARSTIKQERSETQHFDEMAESYDHNYQYDTPFHQYKIKKKMKIFTSEIGSLRRPTRNTSSHKNQHLQILEIGCGTGEYTQHIARKFPHAHITAIDISPRIIRVAKRKCKKYRNITFAVQSAYTLPYRRSSFDVVCGFYILHHLTPTLVMKEMHRVLRKGGTFFFYEPNLLNPVVFLIKKVPLFKKMAGDSPDEWAVNPLRLGTIFRHFQHIHWQTSEYLPSASLPLSLMRMLDEIMSSFSSLPILRYLGGSIWIFGQK